MSSRRWLGTTVLLLVLDLGGSTELIAQNRQDGGDVRFSDAHGVAVTSYGSQSELSDVRITGTDRLLICVVSVEPRVSDITVADVLLENGGGQQQQPLTQLGSYYSAPNDGLKWSTWYLLAPRLGANRRVVATLSEPALTTFLACVSYVGVDQVNPFGPISTVSGASGNALIVANTDVPGSLPWAHLFSSNAGYFAGGGVVNRQETSPHGGFLFSALVDGGAPQPEGNFAFEWSYAGEFGAQASVIHPAVP
jgi:hypothetical protein